MTSPRLYQRDQTPLPPTELRAAGEIFGSDAAYLAEAAADRDRLRRHTRLQGASVLDFGCGVGRLYFGLHADDVPRTYVGADVSRRAVAWAKQAIEARNPHFSFVHCDVHNERYNASGALGISGWRRRIRGRFDVIYAYSVLAHMTQEDAQATLALFAEHVRSRGVVLLTAFVAEDAPECELNSERFGVRPRRPLHVVGYNTRHFEALLATDFEIVERQPCAATHGQTVYVLTPRHSEARAAD